MEAASGPEAEKLLELFERALLKRPHLLIEIGYTRPTGWMVHIWDATGCGIKLAKKLICTQHDELAEACRQARARLQEIVGT